MSSLFDEILLDPLIFSAGDAVGGPEFANTNIKNALTGVFKTNINRFDFQQSWTIDFNQLNHTQRLYLMQFWVGGFGSGYGFRCWIFNDFYMIAEVQGTSDGTSASRTWLLIKTYRRPGASHSYSKRIIKPVVNGARLAGGCPTLYEPDGVTTRVIPTAEGVLNSVPAFTLYFNGVAQSTGYTISNTTGTIVLTAKTFTADASTNIFTISAHGFSNGDEIKLENSGGALPAPLVAGTSYFVRDVTTNTFKLAATLGGSAIDITTNGTGTNSVSAPSVGTVISVSCEFDYPVKIMQNSLGLKADLQSEVKSVLICEQLPAEFGVV